MSERLRKSDIIRSQSELDHLFREGRRLYGKYVFFIYQSCSENNDSSSGRAAFIAGRRFGKAVQRNRIKRRMREIFRRNRQFFAHYRILIIARRNPRTVSFKNLHKEILELAAKMRSEHE